MSPDAVSHERLIRRLKELRVLRPRRDAPPSAPARLSDVSGGPRSLAAELLVRRDGGRDPLTGHRAGAEGLQVAARAATWLVEVQVRHEQRGPALRGQVVSTTGGAIPPGSLVHVRTRGTVRLSGVDARGEFALEGLDSEPRVLLLEMEDEVLSVELEAAGGASS